MTLLTAVFAAVICTVIWYKSASARELKVGTLCWMFWGASCMWVTPFLSTWNWARSILLPQAPICSTTSSWVSPLWLWPW